MRKKFGWALLGAVFCAAMIVAATGSPAEAKKDVAAGTLIKGKTIPTVYYLGEDGKRYVFPNAKTFHSWFDDFSGVTEIEDANLYLYPLGGNVHYRPGALLVKIQTDPKVYAVSANGTLRWVKSEALARRFYGANWNLLIDDIPDSFFTNYQVGDPIDDESDFDAVEEEEEAPTVSYNLGLKKQKRIAARVASQQQKRCQWLNHAINKMQKRMTLWGIEAPELGSDWLDQCTNAAEDDEDENGADNDKKVVLCHIPPGNPAGAHTITVGKAAARAHLAHGDTLGACTAGEEPGEEEEPDTTAPVISSVGVTAGLNGATVSWTTDEAADSKVEFATAALAGAGTITVVLGDNSTTSHSVTLTGLTASTTYYYIVKSADAAGNTAVSPEATFTTTTTEPEPEPEPDTTAPVISAVAAAVSSTSATITWTTDEAADSKVVYADEPTATASTTGEVTDTALVISHSLELSGLTASTTYYYYAVSKDEADNTATGAELTFTTPTE